MIFHHQSRLILPDLTQEILLDCPNCEDLILLHPTSYQLYTNFGIFLDNLIIGSITLWRCVRVEFHIGMYELFVSALPPYSIWDEKRGWRCYQKKLDQLLQDLPASFNMYFMLSLCYSSSWCGWGEDGMGCVMRQERGERHTCDETNTCKGPTIAKNPIW